MFDSNDVVHAWRRAGNSMAPDRLGLYASALSSQLPIGSYSALNDAQEDCAILAMYRVDRPHATIADLHQMPPLALSSYHQLLHDLAREGLGPVDHYRSDSIGDRR
ncbi:hypothetical protein SPF06_03840 [Sinomonas sp. JGH33]|uniref:Uncharacterized protein n=1 Tax=Sinomonas terricola TaxID=3110330 RepID=A0ABU5T2P8_9MICC|nr:hypothetical protein [Sinomonas sp. JGH33]MEA5453845.1 hypothetical protein [Sinomonas sp. JGH33]